MDAFYKWDGKTRVGEEGEVTSTTKQTFRIEDMKINVQYFPGSTFTSKFAVLVDGQWMVSLGLHDVKAKYFGHNVLKFNNKTLTDVTHKGVDLNGLVLFGEANFTDETYSLPFMFFSHYLEKCSMAA